MIEREPQQNYIESSEPSAEWTEEERKHVAIVIAEEIEKITSDNRSILNIGYINEAAQRMRLVLSADAGVLEQNREQILRGKLKPDY